MKRSYRFYHAKRGGVMNSRFHLGQTPHLSLYLALDDGRIRRSFSIFGRCHCPRIRGEHLRPPPEIPRTTALYRPHSLVALAFWIGRAPVVSSSPLAGLAGARRAARVVTAPGWAREGHHLQLPGTAGLAASGDWQRPVEPVVGRHR